MLFSTDKAVDPTSILGRTKAVAEWIVAAGDAGAQPGPLRLVRLGNVHRLGGQHAAILRSQVARGGP